MARKPRKLMTMALISATTSALFQNLASGLASRRDLSGPALVILPQSVWRRQGYSATHDLRHSGRRHLVSSSAVFAVGRPGRRRSRR